MGISKGWGCFPVRVATTSKWSITIQHYIQFKVCIKRCHVWKILYLVNFKACQDGDAHRHYTLILGHQGLLHSWARGWNHSVTACKQRNKERKKKKNTFWLIYWLGLWSRTIWADKESTDWTVCTTTFVYILQVGLNRDPNEKAFYSTDTRPQTAITQTFLFFNKRKQGNKINEINITYGLLN